MDIFELLSNQRTKSVSANCSRVVKDLHRHLDSKTAKVKELETIIDTLKNLSFETIEQEIGYLEKRKIDLLNELEVTNHALADRRERLRSAQDNITTILNNRIHKRSEDDILYTSYSFNVNSPAATSSGDDGVGLVLNSITNTPIRGDVSAATTSSRTTSPINSGKSDIVASNSALVQKLSAEEQKARSLEDDYVEEKNLLDTTRELEPALLFMIHRDDISDTIIYRQPRQESEIIGIAKAVSTNTFMYSSTYLTELSDAEFSHSYGPKIVPNHEREYPNIKELAVPSSNAIFSESPSPSAGRIGYLVGAVELPITPNVIIDVWRDSVSNRMWTTTAIGSHSFVVLERVFIITETDWMGSTTVTQVDLFGRHPVKNYLLMESITADDE